jgi:hypothetical protein
LIDLDVRQIENAGIRAVLQTPGAAYGAWSMWQAAPVGAPSPIVPLSLNEYT